eukprot:scaffold1472_cov300-Pinguiococcus_pyrenoidosus.AAC.2
MARCADISPGFLFDLGDLNLLRDTQVPLRGEDVGPRIVAAMNDAFVAKHASDESHRRSASSEWYGFLEAAEHVLALLMEENPPICATHPTFSGRF